VQLGEVNEEPGGLEFDLRGNSPIDRLGGDDQRANAIEFGLEWLQVGIRAQRSALESLECRIEISRTAPPATFFLNTFALVLGVFYKGLWCIEEGGSHQLGEEMTQRRFSDNLERAQSLAM